MHSARTRRVLAVSVAAGVVFCVGVLFWLQCMTTYTTDDYSYAAFCGDGLRSFAEKNVAHYLTRNGRVWVHLVAELILSGGFVCFAAVSAGLLAILLWAGGRVFGGLTARTGGFRWLCAGAVFYAALLIPGYAVLRSGLLCVADVCNYVLPLTVTLSAFSLLCGMDAGRHPRAAGLTAVGLCLLAGAATEQNALLTIVLLGAHLAERLIRRRGGLGWPIAALVCTAAGLVTVLLSPATQARVQAEVTLTGLQKGLQMVASAFAAPRRMLPVAVLFCAALWCFARAEQSRPRLLRASLPVGAVLAAGFFLPQSVWLNTLCFVLFCLLVLVSALALIISGACRHGGCLLLAGLCAVLMPAVTASGSVRTCVPFMLCLVLASAFLLAADAPRTPIRAAAVVLSLVAIAALRVPPILAGVGENYIILRQNEAAVEDSRKTGVLEYTDYVPYYALCEMFNGAVFESAFCEKYRLGDVQIVPHVQPYASTDTDCPAILWRGEPYVHLRSVLEKNGGSLHWLANDYIFFSLDGRRYLYDAPYTLPLSPFGRPLDDRAAFFVYENNTYVSAALLEALGATWRC